MPLRHWIQLALAEGLGPILIERLIEAAGSAEAACAAPVGLLRSIDGIGASKAQAIHRALRDATATVDDELARAASLGVSILCREDEAYPPLLRSIPDPPAVLYMKGTLEPRDLNAVAIVGSRKCSHYGREQAERFAALLAGAGITVVSGGARGIDSTAHRGALQHTIGRTIAVLGCGIDVVYPPENEALFNQIAARGAILSEYPLGTAPLSGNFPRRNRIVSGLSRGVLVVEADTRSGALITARQACDDHGRPVFALPGRVDNPLSQGPHQLIRDGAVLVRSLEDIVEELAPLPDDVAQPMLFEPSGSIPLPPATVPPLPPGEGGGKGSPLPTSTPVSLTPQQQQVLKLLDGEPLTIDHLIDQSGLDAQIVLQELTFLSLKGVVRRLDNQTYARHIGRK